MNKRYAILALTSTMDVIPIKSSYAKEIADFIEQQAKQITELMQIIDSQKETNLVLGNKALEDVKHAELGFLIADRDSDINICPISSFSKRCKEACNDYDICKLRAELLAGEQP